MCRKSPNWTLLSPNEAFNTRNKLDIIGLLFSGNLQTTKAVVKAVSPQTDGEGILLTANCAQLITHGEAELETIDPLPLLTSVQDTG